MHRFFLKPEDCSAKQCVSSDTTLLHQLTSVLRLKDGDECILLDGSGREFCAIIQQLTKKRVLFQVKKVSPNKSECFFEVKLFQALPKSFPRFEWLIEKATELGVTHIIPIVTDRTERVSFSKRGRLERIIKEAAEQSHRGKLPHLNNPISFESSLSFACDLRLLAHEGVSSLLLSKIQFNPSSFSGSIGLWIGPEGGFSEKEIQKARDHDLLVVSLGPRILRTETAGIVLLSALLLP